MATTTCTTIVTTTTITTTTVPLPNTDITTEGSVVASSRRCGSWDVRFAVDGDLSTSWLSGSAGLDGATVTWTGASDDLIGSIELVSNAFHYDEVFRTNHGFEIVQIEIFDQGGVVVWDAIVDLSGTPDPDIVVEPYVVGRSILLTFFGPEDSSTGGFAELTVLAVR